MVGRSARSCGLRMLKTQTDKIQPFHISIDETGRTVWLNIVVQAGWEQLDL